jgi:hypothetical protein
MSDVDGVALTSTAGALGGFVFNPAEPLSANLQRFFLPSLARQGRFRRFHIFCSVEDFALEADGVTLTAAARQTIRARGHGGESRDHDTVPDLPRWLF